MTQGPIIRDYDRKTHKKCIKCRSWKPRAGDERGFGDNPTSSDGLQSICYTCKNAANNKARERNVVARLRHHVSTRCLTQLGPYAPAGFVRDLEDYLGYKIRTLVKHLREDLRAREGPSRKLRDALNEGYHVDHKRPLSSFLVVTESESETETETETEAKGVNWEVFRDCWAIENLSAIPAEENLAKGATYESPAEASPITATATSITLNVDGAEAEAEAEAVPE